MTQVLIVTTTAAFDAHTRERTNCVYLDHSDFQPYYGFQNQNNIKKEKPYHKFTQRRLDGRFQK
jgi:hypothetical protein